MSITIFTGAPFDSYEIPADIGASEMGVVYRVAEATHQTRQEIMRFAPTIIEFDFGVNAPDLTYGHAGISSSSSAVYREDLAV